MGSTTYLVENHTVFLGSLFKFRLIPLGKNVSVPCPYTLTEAGGTRCRGSGGLGDQFTKKEEELEKILTKSKFI